MRTVLREPCGRPSTLRSFAGISGQRDASNKRQEIAATSKGVSFHLRGQVRHHAREEKLT
jgi:hypothetical protein